MASPQTPPPGGRGLIANYQSFTPLLPWEKGSGDEVLSHKPVVQLLLLEIGFYNLDFNPVAQGVQLTC
jgi:hypothetical protein